MRCAIDSSEGDLARSSLRGSSDAFTAFSLRRRFSALISSPTVLKYTASEYPTLIAIGL